ncbi:hypothetical protein [Streptomyces acidiscabies]|uniref:hypothetical protein n=1 Tax=Streptomyces acidiscabies TaxID=42234 RepID=UPI000950BA94|nr:hypothetical protein [Streptomyces acidiscabies]
MCEGGGLLTRAERTSSFNPFSLYGIRRRGLVATGRTAEAIPLVEHGPAPTMTVATQGRVIQRISMPHVRFFSDERKRAEEFLKAVVRAARSWCRQSGAVRARLSRSLPM